jgi:hypothetical protein
VLLALAFAGAAVVSSEFSLVLLAYLTLTTAYSISKGLPGVAGVATSGSRKVSRDDVATAVPYQFAWTRQVIHDISSAPRCRTRSPP